MIEKNIKIFMETSNRVKIGNNLTLFMILIAYLEEVLRKGQARGVVVAKDKCMQDDIMTLATSERELREMKLLNESKSKVTI